MGTAGSLFILALSLSSFIFFKNFFRYMAMYFLAVVRNGVVKDLRNALYKKDFNPAIVLF